jgi:hypothetical protein
LKKNYEEILVGEKMEEEKIQIQPLALKGKRQEFVVNPKQKKRNVKSKKKVSRSLKQDLLTNYGFYLNDN